MSSHHTLLPQTENTPVQAGKNDAAIDYPARNEFVVALLNNLQRDHYTPLAWWRFFADAWKQSRLTSREHPDLARSWAYISVLVSTLTLGCWCALWHIEGMQTAWHILPALLVCLALELGDVYVHLGLNYHPGIGTFRERLGIPTILTLVRGIMANVLLAHLLSGRIPLPSVILSAYGIGIATDIVDGQIARRSDWLTRLGGYLDSEADLFLSISTVLCALLLGALPIWLALAMLLRFLIPLLGALFSYFVAIRQIDLSHTAWGRSAGVVQAICLTILLAPGNLPYVFFPISLPLMLVTLALLGLAAFMDIKKTLVFWEQQRATSNNSSK
jgi:phosphatidylglycerophosphate synthase